MNSTSVALENVCKRYGPLVAVGGVSLDIVAGTRVALLGHNGAGKTTLLRLVLGLTRPDTGRITILGDAAGSNRVANRLAYLPENLAFHSALTGAEQLALFARLKSKPASIVPGLMERVGLTDAMHRRIATWSKGMRQRLGLAQILIGSPQVVILDEPTTGLDPFSRDLFYKLVSGLAEDGAAVILSSHALTEIEASADRIVILRKGRVVADGRLAELRAGTALPVRLRVAVQHDAMGEVATRFGGAPINGRAIEISCRSEEKLGRLAALSALGPAIEDIEIVPPGLEDIYRFYNGRPVEEGAR